MPQNPQDDVPPTTIPTVTSDTDGGKYATKPHDIETMPPGIPYIIGNEAAERFSFYGMNAILTVFMTKMLMDSAGVLDTLSDEGAKAAVGWFKAATYATPLVGAILADTLLGKYRTIMLLSLLYCAGHAVLALVDQPNLVGIQPRWILWIGLGLIACGAGGIKPCVSSHVGDQFGKRNQHLMSRVYGWFYFSINFGSTFATLLTPWLLTHKDFGPAYAFGIPGVLMALATFVFWMGRNKYIHVPPAGKKFFEETFSADGIRALLFLTPLLFLAAPFWSLFDQTHSAWVLQADKMDRTLIDGAAWGLGTWKLEPSASQLQATNPIMVMILVPLFTYLLYPFLDRYIKLTPLRKIGTGLFLAAISFAIVAHAESLIVQNGTTTVWWQILAYLVLTMGEVLLSITLLEFFYTQSPRSMKSVIMAIYLLSVSLGNIITAVVNMVIRRADGTLMLEGASYYLFFVALVVADLLLFLLWSQFYRGQTFIQGDDTPTH